MFSDVNRYVKDCYICQQHKLSPGLQQLWQELPPVTIPLERVSLDLISGYQGYRYVLTVLDHYSRYVKFYPLRTKGTNEVCEMFGRYVGDFTLQSP